MADVHEEAQLGLAHLLGVDMSLEAQTVLLSVIPVGKELPCEETQDECIEEVGPCGTIPWTTDDDGETAFRCLDTVALSLHPETIGARREMGERYLVVTGRQRMPVLTVDTI